MMETTTNAESTAAMNPQAQHHEDVATVEQKRGIKVRVIVTNRNSNECSDAANAEDVPSPVSNDSTEGDAVLIKNGEVDGDDSEEVERDESVEAPVDASESADHNTELDIDSLKIEADDKTDATVATSGYMIESPPSNPVSSDETDIPQQSVTLAASSSKQGKATERDNTVEETEVKQEESQNPELVHEEKNESGDNDGGGNDIDGDNSNNNISQVDQSQCAILQGDNDDNNNNNNGNDSRNVLIQSPLQDIPVTPMSSVCPWSVDPAYNYDNLPKMEIIPDEPVNLKELKIGDHVYQWRSWIGIPGVFQHHGIVIDIQQVPTEDDEEDEEIDDNNQDDNDQDDFDDAQKTDIVQESIPVSPRKSKKTVTQLTIADFSNIVKHRKGMTSAASPPNHKSENQSKGGESQTSTEEASEGKMVVVDEHKSLFSLEQRGNLRVFQTTETHTWYKVHYEAPFWKRQVFSRAGTCTSVKSDPVGLVLARVHFILDHPEVLPDYHVLYANCECVAMWCKTGQWSTLQAASFLEYTAAGQAKSAATIASAAAHTQVTVPATGLWGWLGYTTKVSLMTAQPMVVPALAAYGVVTAGGPALLYQAAKNKWKQNTNDLHAAFWEAAMESPDKFSDNMAEWSQHV